MPTGNVKMARPKRVKGRTPAPLKTIGIKASLPYAEWVEEVARHDRSTVAAVFDRAIAMYAASIGFKKAPPERIE